MTFRVAKRTDLTITAIAIIMVLGGFAQAAAEQEKFLMLDERIIESVQNANTSESFLHDTRALLNCS